MKYFRFISGVALAVGALGVALPMSSATLPDSQTSTVSLSAHQRPLQIDGASKAIERATVYGPRFYAPEIFPGIEDYHNPRLKRLRDEYGLEKVIAGESEEFRGC